MTDDAVPPRQGDVLVPLSDARAGDPTLAGWKAARLARLLAAGFHVPPGLVLPAAVGQQVLVSAGDHATEDSVLAELGRPHLRHVAEALDTAPLLLGSPLAVRSSATDEDGAVHSAAGQYESFLGALTGPGVRTAVVECWLSARSARLDAYWRRHPEPAVASAHAVAVLLQPLVEPRCAGVAFSRHPMTSEPDMVVLEATPGLGVPVTEGTCVPEHIEVDLSTGRTSRTPGRRRTRLDPHPLLGIAKSTLDHEAATADVLTRDDVDRVVQLARRVEATLGHPVDVEWALVREAVEPVVLQARPFRD